MIALVRSAVGTLFNHKIIAFPFLIIAAIQLFVLEILYFYPRYPLNKFFGPIISKLWSSEFLHYPNNFILLPKLYQYAQIPGSIFISSFFICLAIAILAKINENKPIFLKSLVKEVFKLYVHIVVACLLMFVLIWYFAKLYIPIYERALLIRAEAGPVYIIKMVTIEGMPYFNLLWSILVTTLMAYVLPIIIIEKKKIFSALWSNLVFLSKTFWPTLGMILWPSLLFVPILWLRNVVLANHLLPEFSFLMLIISVCLTVLIDAIIYTSVTSYYLWKAEQ